MWGRIRGEHRRLAMLVSELCRPTTITTRLALLLQGKNQYAEAADYRYLAADAKSEWATRARRSLKFCEMQGHLLASA